MIQYRVTDTHTHNHKYVAETSPKKAAVRYLNGYQADRTLNMETFSVSIIDEEQKIHKWSAKELGARINKKWKIDCSPRPDLKNTKKEIAYGSSYAISENDFEGMFGRSLTGKPWLLHGAGNWTLITAGKTPVWVAGKPYDTTANGSSAPVEIKPGESAWVRRKDSGSASSFAVWEVRRLGKG